MGSGEAMIELHYFPGNASMVPHIVLDPFAFVLCRWTRGFARPARSLTHLGPYLERVLARAALGRVFAAEDLAPPFV